ncbi:adenosine deaminase [Vicingaceae bacterium]|nr:adenosine deaminase [Vicingaceae bacterium]MDC1451387.1 adenosine deaminase [Vicingaceae bacterium]
MKDIHSFIQKLPKAELHLHIEGTFEPELMFVIAKRNNFQIPFSSVEEVKAAYQFNNLQEFLDIYYAGANVLLTEQDFFELTWAYLTKVASQNVKHVEIFFDPQTHTERGVEFHTVLIGIYKALEEGEKELGITFRLIMSYLRHISEESAFETLRQSLPFKDLIDGVGLDSSEVGNPPEKFQNVFKASAKEGYKLCAHGGEEGPAEYIWSALDILKIDRLDHGNRCLEDEKLVERLVQEQMPLTLCPLSNLELKVIQDLKTYPLKKMMEAGLLVTLNSDDPAYFGGYMNENFLETAKAIDLSKEEIVTLTKNGFEASWLTAEDKEKWKNEVDRVAKEA